MMSPVMIRRMMVDVMIVAVFHIESSGREQGKSRRGIRCQICQCRCKDRPGVHVGRAFLREEWLPLEMK